MEDTKKVILSVVTIAGAIYAIFNFYKEHEEEIKSIIEPAIEACKQVKDLILLDEPIENE